MNISPHNLTFHPAVELFPRMSDSDYRTLVSSILDAGEVTTPIVLDTKGAVIDGRHRVDACIELDIEVPFRTYRGDDILGHVIALNLHRRHLTESQRAMVAAKMATMKQGDNRFTIDAQIQASTPDEQQALFDAPKPAPSITTVSQSEAAAQLNVSRSAVQSATVVRNQGTPELTKAVESGKVSVNTAAKAAQTLTPEKQLDIIAQAPENLGKAMREEVAKVVEKVEKKKKDTQEWNAFVDKTHAELRPEGFDRAEENRRVNLTHDLYKAMAMLAAMPPVEEMLPLIPEYQDYRFKDLDAALSWFSAFTKAYKESRCERVEKSA